MFNFLLQITYPKITKIGDKKVLQALLGYATHFLAAPGCALLDKTQHCSGLNWEYNFKNSFHIFYAKIYKFAQKISFKF